MNKAAKLTAGVILAISTIVNAVIFVEGGYSDHPFDPGGKTMYGVTEKVARAHGYTGPMEQLTKAQAEVIYTESYVIKPGFDKVIAQSTAVGHKSVDAGVNVGPDRSAMWLQTALNSLSRNGKDYPKVKVDGVVGPNTISAYASLQRIRGRVQACELVLKLMDAQQAAFYISLTRMQDFTVGWISHRIGNVPLERCAHDAI